MFKLNFLLYLVLNKLKKLYYWDFVDSADFKLIFFYFQSQINLLK